MNLHLANILRVSMKNCPGDFSDLDGALGQRRQEMEESSSSDSQIQDYDKMTGNRQISSCTSVT